MSTEQTRCPKCGGRMAQGFVVDVHQCRLAAGQQLGRGRATEVLWFGTTSPDMNGLPIGTFRCENCGFLESFARPEFEAG